MPDARLPIKIKRIPGGYTINLADGNKLWIYGREAEIASQAHAIIGAFSHHMDNAC